MISSNSTQWLKAISLSVVIDLMGHTAEHVSKRLAYGRAFSVG